MTTTAVDIMQTEFLFVDCNATIAEAEECFVPGDVDAIPVLNPDRSVFGILTARNLLDFHRRPASNPHAVHAWEICETRPLVSDGATAISAIAEALLAAPNHHVLVVDDERQLIGVISREDVFQLYVMPLQARNEEDRAPVPRNDPRPL